jgi:hypothetical protein
MKKALTIIIFFIAPTCMFSQSTRYQTQIKTDKSGSEIEYITSNFGLQFSVGRSFLFYDKNTRIYFGNEMNSAIKLSLFYSNFFLGGSFKPNRGPLTDPSDTLHFDVGTEPRSGSLSYLKTELFCGYTIELPYNFSIEPMIGYLRTSFTGQDENGNDFESLSKKVGGLTFGFSINKYIKIRNIGDYLVIYLNNNVNYSGYNNYHSALGNSFYAVEIGIAAKGWFLNKTRLN